MNLLIKNSDLALILQNKLDLSIKMEIFDESNHILGVIYGNIIDGEFTIDSESDERRTCQITLLPDKSKNININPDGFIWINKSAKFYIGIKNKHTQQDIWYNQGYYYFKDSSSTYDSSTKTLKISCYDYMIKLNGIKNGNIGGAIQTIIPAYEENKETGEVIKYNTIRDTIINILEQLGNIKNHIIDDIGEHNAMPQVSNDWENYRKKHPLWNTIPYDLNFSAGCSVFSILSELRDLYSNYEMFFDTNGTFICQMIPTCDNDDIVFDNSFFQKILISEDYSLDLSSVKNICEVWGATIDANQYIEECDYKENLYKCNLNFYDKYNIKDKISIKIPFTNKKDSMLQINNLPAIPIYNQSTDNFIDAGVLEQNKRYVFKIDNLTIDNSNTTVAYLLGQCQPHAITALTNGKLSNELYITPDNRKIEKYSEEYFKERYNCNRVSLFIVPNSPFAVQHIGEILDIKNDNEYNNISSDELAIERAEYENWLNCQLKDSITIKTKIVPFADVNMKCSYKRSDLQITYLYIIKSITHNFTEGTTTWNMYRFYPSKKKIQTEAGTHKILGDYLHMTLGKYSHEELQKLWGGEIY